MNNFFHSPPTHWSEAYKEWLALAEIHKLEEEKCKRTGRNTAPTELAFKPK